VYFGTGNGVPQYAGDERAGTNLYLCSLVALDLKTGKLKWYYQTIRHDIWEADIAQSPVIFNTALGGRERKLVAAMRTDGVLLVVDRETGKPILPIEERKVAQDKASHTLATQPYPAGADRMLDDCETWSKKPIPAGFKLGCFFAPASMDVPNLLTPAWGMRVTPMAYSPQTGYFYALGNSSLQWFRRAEDPYVFILGGGRVPGMPAGHGVMAAIDGKTSKIVWKKEFTGPRPSGALATASGLLFQSLPDGNLIARVARTGEQIWQFQSGMNGGGGPAVSYEIDGEQGALPVQRTGPGHQQGRNGQLRPRQLRWRHPDVHRRARVQPVSHTRQGRTTVRWVNNGRINHTVVAEDGSWTTPRLVPLEAAAVTFDKPGEYTVICKDHPWAKSQVIVTP